MSSSESISASNTPHTQTHTSFETQRYSTANPYESAFSYSRAVRRGPFIFVSGTTSIDPITGVLLHPSSAYDQSRQIFTNIVEAIEALGGKRECVTRVRMFVRDQGDSGEVGRALKDALGDVMPAATMILGVGFVDEEMKVEIEADALVFW